MMLLIMVMMMHIYIYIYNTNKCHTFVTLIRFIKGDDDDTDDDDEVYIKRISVTRL